MLKFHAPLLLLGLAGLLACLLVRLPAPVPGAAADPHIVEYDAAMPGLLCIADRVIAESDPRLTAGQRKQLWRDYGLRVSFEWLVPDTGFTYHELAVRPWNIGDQVWARLTQRSLAPRELPALIAALSEDPRLHWAAPDALLLQWAAEPAQLEDLPASGAARVTASAAP